MFDRQSFEALFVNQLDKKKALPILTTDQLGNLSEWTEVTIGNVELVTREGRNPYLRVTYVDKTDRWMFKQVYFQAKSYNGFNWATVFKTIDESGFDPVKAAMLNQELSVKIKKSDPDVSGNTYPNVVDHQTENTSSQSGQSSQSSQPKVKQIRGSAPF